MTEQQAQQIISLVYDCFRDLVEVRQVTDQYEAHDVGVYLFNRLLQRYIILWNTEEWPGMRDCWLTALDKPVVENTPIKPKTSKNLWSFWH